MRFSGAGRRETSANLNEAVLKWIEEARGNRQRVSRRLIKLQAKKIASELVKEEKMVEGAFVASNGWLDKFMERNGFSLRRVTTQCQKTPAVLAPSLVNFVMFIRKKRMERRYPYGQVYAADETAVWIDPVGRTCVTHKGAKEVAVRSTGHEKMHITVMLCAKENGAKCLPFVLLPRKRPIPEVVQKFKGKLLLSWCGSVWMNQEQTSDFLHRVIGNFAFGNRLLVWDSFRCHISEQTKDELKKMKVDMAAIPGGCTKYVQAPDVSWNKPFKQKIEEYYSEWLFNGEMSYTQAGNLRAPPMETYLQWVVDACNLLPTDLIKNSFKCCGVSNATDGSEDHLIHVFKQDGSCPEGMVLLTKAMKKMEEGNIVFVEEDEEKEEEEDDFNQNIDSGDDSDYSIELY
uniref:HTH CENPB-type domain-containing protein n=1 Tax=Plectus sambesii TaxID=2011161 RepID=A0A914WZ70_9BILA